MLALRLLYKLGPRLVSSLNVYDGQSTVWIQILLFPTEIYIFAEVWKKHLLRLVYTSHFGV